MLQPLNFLLNRWWRSCQALWSPSRPFSTHQGVRFENVEVKMKTEHSSDIILMLIGWGPAFLFVPYNIGSVKSVDMEIKNKIVEFKMVSLAVNASSICSCDLDSYHSHTYLGKRRGRSSCLMLYVYSPLCDSFHE